MFWYDTNAPHPIVYYYDGSAWNSMPMGVLTGWQTGVAAMTVPVGSGNGETDVNGSPITVTLEDGLRYAYEGAVTFLGNTANDSVLVRVRENGTTIDAYQEIVLTTKHDRANFRVIVAPGAGTYTYKVTFQYSGSGSTQVIGGTDITFSHIGST